MPARLSAAERDRFLRGRRVAVLVTTAPDGTPVPTPIWYLYRDGAFHFRTAAGAVKTANLRREPRVAICVQDERPPYRAVVAYGDAAVGEPLDWLGDALPRHYLGFFGAIGYRSASAQIQQGPEVTITLRPLRFASFDFSAETPWYGRLWLLAKRVLPPWL